MIETVSGACTDTGRRRRENQDALLVRGPVALVSDGMGGHRDGALAAAAVVDAFASVSEGSELHPVDLQLAIEQAHLAVAAVGDGAQNAAAPGATVSGVAASSQDGRAAWLVFNVGDSRTYLLRSGTLELLTVDHSQRQQLRDAGLSEAEAARQVGANVITRAVGGGMPQAPMVDQWLVPASLGDRLLICSDGVSSELSDPLLAATLLEHRDPQAAADALVSLAVQAGGRDNATAVVVDAVAVSEGSLEWEDAEDTLGGIAPCASEELDDIDERTSEVGVGG